MQASVEITIPWMLSTVCRYQKPQRCFIQRQLPALSTVAPHFRSFRPSILGPNTPSSPFRHDGVQKNICVCISTRYLQKEFTYYIYCVAQYLNIFGPVTRCLQHTAVASQPHHCSTPPEELNQFLLSSNHVCLCQDLTKLSSCPETEFGNLEAFEVVLQQVHDKTST